MGAWFSCRLGDFDRSTALEKLGALAQSSASGFASQYSAQIRAWEAEFEILDSLAIELLKAHQKAGDWGLVLEYEIPRRQKRPDVILLARDLIYVLEFKVGATSFDRASEWQVEEYALDLRDFHAGSRDRRIVPVVVATGVSDEDVREPEPEPSTTEDLVRSVQHASPRALATLISSSFGSLTDQSAIPLLLEDWVSSPYRPTLNIIEAAEELFERHSVRDISHAFADNLEGTCDALVEAIQEAQGTGKRLICFVTGVPGSGKTLTGLSSAHDPRLRKEGRPTGIFLSGNGPLVKIVREALARDRARQGSTKKEARREVSTFIQNVHTFLREYGVDKPDQGPHENVIIFDEAQRAWDRLQAERKRGVSRSEPELTLDIMERAPEWSVIIALVGSGQEIHTGEAGLREWGRALAERETGWEVWASPEVLVKNGSGERQKLFELESTPVTVFPDSRLHLSVNVRSPRAKRLSDWVDHLLTGDPDGARQLLSRHRGFPVVLTRDLDEARSWLRDRSRDDRRCGLVASSGARRLRSYGLEMSTGFRHDYKYEHWFLSGPDDIRSSYQLEVVASQFECQGLELDWVGVCWGGDFLWDAKNSKWQYRRFVGSRWCQVRKPEDQAFLLNRYRVLLTRAREGMVIWVPHGISDDETWEIGGFEATAEYLLAAGLQALTAGEPGLVRSQPAVVS